MEIKDFLLKGSNVTFKKTPNHSGEFKAGDLDTIIIHYTAGPSVQSAVNTLTNPKVKASAHLVVGRDGSVVQLAPFNIVTWHAGVSSYNGRTGFNKYSIGIEIDNAGILEKSGNVYRAWFGSTYTENEVIQAVHRNRKEPKYWHAYTAEQIEAVFDICSLLVDSYNIKFILGHEEITSQKIDPGPAFPLDRLRDKLLSTGRNTDDGDISEIQKVVSASKLNIRSQPNSTAEKVALALEKGTKVKVLQVKGEWSLVRTEIDGWVATKFLDIM